MEKITITVRQDVECCWPDMSDGKSVFPCPFIKEIYLLRDFETEEEIEFAFKCTHPSFGMFGAKVMDVHVIPENCPLRNEKYRTLNGKYISRRMFG